MTFTILGVSIFQKRILYNVYCRKKIIITKTQMQTQTNINTSRTKTLGSTLTAFVIAMACFDPFAALCPQDPICKCAWLEVRLEFLPYGTGQVCKPRNTFDSLQALEAMELAEVFLRLRAEEPVVSALGCLWLKVRGCLLQLPFVTNLQVCGGHFFLY